MGGKTHRWGGGVEDKLSMQSAWLAILIPEKIEFKSAFANGLTGTARADKPRRIPRRVAALCGVLLCGGNSNPNKLTG